MGKIGRFKNDAARETYLAAYAALEPSWPLPARIYEVPTSFGATHVRQSGAGDGIPLVLLPSLGGNGLYWGFIAEALARDRVVYALDMIGAAGKSVQTAPLESEADIAVWFNEVLAGLDVDRVHVLGMSQGAWHASVIALHGPERLASVTLIEPNAIFGKMKWRVLFKIMKFAVNPSDASWRKMTAWLTPGVEMSAEQFACARAAMAYRTGLGWARVLKDEELQSITTPLLAIFGGDSVACEPVRDVERITAHLPNAQTRIYPGMGHGVLDRIPEQVVPRILRFLAERDRVGAVG
ncbi:alpha/beta hydrolase [Nocardia yamanashiensis]|uniref:alpha/beta fold hydrolase n=1 Tax=Nocardia yamanashiensis TaxID=209247 RepID=UPI001E3EA7DA|nr:alpha/beta hydrolase [Nocardia yamanashiensis]UGT42888.1 alpha/beta hydrolase [Nocardia yamanashiensis]